MGRGTQVLIFVIFAILFSLTILLGDSKEKIWNFYLFKDFISRNIFFSARSPGAQRRA